MNLRPMRVPLVLALAAVLIGGLVWVLGDADSTPSSSERDDRSMVEASGARTRLAGLAVPTGEPTLPGLAAARPRAGDVTTVSGPFDDRFSWTDLSFDGEQVTGVLTVTSDVSDLLELEVVAGFYDASGRLVATRRFVHHAAGHSEPGSHAPREDASVTVHVPARLRDTVVAAALGVPVLVNE